MPEVTCLPNVELRDYKTDIQKAEKFLSVDEILPIIGEFGKMQKFITLVVCAHQLVNTFPVLIMYFAALEPNWRCVENSTICSLNGTFLPTHEPSRCGMPRGEWEYAEHLHFSVVTEYDLSCDRDWFIYMTTSAFFIGTGIGYIGMGWLQDNIGRKIVLYASTGLNCLFTLAIAFSPNIELFIFLRFCVGVVWPGGAFLVGTEMVGEKWRPVAGNIIWIFWTTGLCLVALIAFYVPEWNLMFLLTSLPLIWVVLTWKAMPESARFLNTKGRNQQALNVLRRIGRVNKRPLDDNIGLKAVENAGKHTNPVEIFTHSKKLCKYTIIQGIGWFTQGLVYYGIAHSAGDLGGDLYVNYVLGSLSEFPAIFIGMWSCNYFGRKPTINFTMFVASLCCIAVNFIPKEHATWVLVRVAVGTFGKFCITLSYNCIFVWSMELYPTQLRGEGVGFCGVMGQIGGAVSPWVAKGLGKIDEIIPFIIMGVAGIATSALMMKLPETKGQDMEGPGDLEEDD